jgi:inositol 1,4,5-triphosphate receptor type 1
LLLDDYRELITGLEEVVPARQIRKLGKNFRIGFGTDNQLQFEKYDTVAEEGRAGDKKSSGGGGGEAEVV